MTMQLSRQRFQFIIFILCLCYLSFELFFNAYAKLSVDEFWFAHRIFQYQDGLPYKDFSPYKTVLGYYLLLIPMQLARYFSVNILDTLLIMKNTLAVTNTFVLLITSYWLSRFFSFSAIIFSLALLIFSNIFLTTSTQIRVDLLSYWFCLFALLFLLENKSLCAGIFLGLGFITSQKTIWYIFTANITFIITLFFNIYFREPLLFRVAFKKIILFNLAIATIILPYLIIWSFVSDFHTVMQNVFVDASIMYQLDTYNQTRALFWFSILLYNPLPYFLMPFGFFSLLITSFNDEQYKKRRFIVIFSAIILTCLIFYKQVFPYYMQVTFPIFLVLYASLFSWLFGLVNQPTTLKSFVKPITLRSLLTLYSIMIAMMMLSFRLPLPYLMTASLPILFGFYIIPRLETSIDKKNYSSSLSIKLMFSILIIMTFIYPFSLQLRELFDSNGNYQKAQIVTISHLLEDGSDYLAGIELIYNKTQPIAGMRHLMIPAIQFLEHPTKKLAKVMLASLYEDPNATIESVIKDLENSKVKFYVNNYRIYSLPKTIEKYLQSHYQHFWGSIYTYSPVISAGKQFINIQFSGDYKIEGRKNEFIELNNKRYQTALKKIYLTKGNYLSNAKDDYRLTLVIDKKKLFLNPLFQKDQWQEVLN